MRQSCAKYGKVTAKSLCSTPTRRRGNSCYTSNLSWKSILQRRPSSSKALFQCLATCETLTRGFDEDEALVND